MITLWVGAISEFSNKKNWNSPIKCVTVGGIQSSLFKGRPEQIARVETVGPSDSYPFHSIYFILTPKSPWPVDRTQLDECRKWKSGGGGKEIDFGYQF